MLVDKEQVVDVLNDAADLLELYGWCRGRTEDSRGRRCALGALGACAGLNIPLFQAGNYALASYLVTEGGKGGSAREFSVVDWNDDPYRTANDVVTALRKTSIRERELA